MLVNVYNLDATGTNIRGRALRTRSLERLSFMLEIRISKLKDCQSQVEREQGIGRCMPSGQGRR